CEKFMSSTQGFWTHGRYEQPGGAIKRSGRGQARTLDLPAGASMGGGEPIDAPADSMHFAPPDPVGGTVWGETSVGRSFCPKPVAEGVDWGDMQVARTPRRP